MFRKTTSRTIDNVIVLTFLVAAIAILTLGLSQVFGGSPPAPTPAAIRTRCYDVCDSSESQLTQIHVRGDAPATITGFECICTMEP